MKRPTGTKVETKTIVMSIENIEAAIASFLYQMRAVPESWDITFMDLGLPFNEEGFVEFDIEIVRPAKKDHLRLVDDTPVQDNQMVLPLEHFEKIRVD